MQEVGMGDAVVAWRHFEQPRTQDVFDLIVVRRAGIEEVCGQREHELEPAVRVRSFRLDSLVIPRRDQLFPIQHYHLGAVHYSFWSPFDTLALRRGDDAIPQRRRPVKLEPANCCGFRRVQYYLADEVLVPGREHRVRQEWKLRRDDTELDHAGLWCAVKDLVACDASVL